MTNLQLSLLDLFRTLTDVNDMAKTDIGKKLIRKLNTTLRKTCYDTTNTFGAMIIGIYTHDTYNSESKFLGRCVSPEAASVYSAQPRIYVSVNGDLIS